MHNASLIFFGKERKLLEENYTTVRINGHFEVYNENDEFILSGDSYHECENELRELKLASSALHKKGVLL